MSEQKEGPSGAVGERDPLPDFLVIGAMKSGSTSLHRYLQNHPRIFMSTPKELHYFTGESNWKLGYDWYTKHFRAAEPTQRLGEASTSYTKFPRKRGIPARIAGLIPRAKLIYLVREPISRMRSHYLHELSKGREKLPFDRAVRQNPDYLDFSRYSLQIEQYLEHFPREQILVLLSEDLRADRAGTLEAVWQFLDVPSWSDPVFERNFNATEQRRVMRPTELWLRRLPGFRTAVKLLPLSLKKRVREVTTRPLDPSIDRADVTPGLEREIRNELKEDVSRLSTFLERDLSHWGFG